MSASSLPSNAPCVIVFDLDETIGDFSQFSQLYYSLVEFRGLKQLRPLCLLESFLLIEVCIEMFRPFIFQILASLRALPNVKLVLYTNNNGSLAWCHLLVHFLQAKIQCSHLFDDILYGQQNNMYLPPERRRSSAAKVYEDIIRICRLPTQTRVFMMDDVLHPNLASHALVQYCHIPAYHVDLSISSKIQIMARNPALFGFLADGPHWLRGKCFYSIEEQRRRRATGGARGGKGEEAKGKQSEYEVYVSMAAFVQIKEWLVYFHPHQAKQLASHIRRSI